MIKIIKFTLKERFSIFLKIIFTVERWIFRRLKSPKINQKNHSTNLKPETLFFQFFFGNRKFLNLHAKSCEKKM